MRDLRAVSAREGRTVTWVGAIVNAALIILKFAAGIWGHSHALIADAFHSFSDLFTDVIVLAGLWMGRKAPDERHHFGYARMETLASFMVGMALIGTALYIGIESALNIYHRTECHPTKLALLGAGVSIVLKEALYHYSVRVGRHIKSRLIIANAWHHRSDSLSSVAVLIGVTGAMIRPSWHALDAYAALLVSFFIVKVGLDTIRESIREFTDMAPPQEILDAISACVRGVPGVLDLHDLRVRTSGGLYQMETHIVVDGQQTVFQGHRIANEVERCLNEEIADLDLVTIHVDPATQNAATEG